LCGSIGSSQDESTDSTDYFATILIKKKMTSKLRCFISASNDADLSLLKTVLIENEIETSDIYDFSIGNSIQQILKRKIRQADFALFVISKENTNVIYEMGICEGLGKQHFIFLHKDYKVPVYLDNKLFIRTDLNDRTFLEMSVKKILQSVQKKSLIKSKKSKIYLDKVKAYSEEIKTNLNSFLKQIKKLRKSGHGRELEYILEEIFKSIRLNYVENSTNRDKGVDFALWSNEIGKIIGNPIIVEVKYGNLNELSIRHAEEQLNQYVSKSDARVALLLYLDKENRRHKIKTSLNPLVIAFDVEDFATELLTHSFESLILNQRNKIAHGVE
jgi:hypothetical protein